MTLDRRISLRAAVDNLKNDLYYLSNTETPVSSDGKLLLTPAEIEEEISYVESKIMEYEELLN